MPDFHSLDNSGPDCYKSSVNKTILVFIGISCAALGVLTTIGIFIYTTLPVKVSQPRPRETAAQPLPVNTAASPIPTPVPLPAAELTSEPLSPTVLAVVAPETTGLTPDAEDKIPSWTVDPAKTLGAQKTVPELIQSLQDPDAKVRSRAISSLEKLNAKEAIPDIKKLLADPDPRVRRQAEKSLRKLGVSNEDIQKIKEGK